MTKDKQQRPWVNKIVGYGEEAPDQLLSNEANWRVHPKAQQDALSGVLHEVGIVQNVIINRRSGPEWPDGKRGISTVVDGHARIGIAISEEQPSIPITYVELTPVEEAEVLATFDPIGTMAIADKEQLSKLLHDVQSDDVAIQQMLATLAEKSGIIPPDGIEFPEYDEDVVNDVEYITCPKCGEKIPK